MGVCFRAFGQVYIRDIYITLATVVSNSLFTSKFQITGDWSCAAYMSSHIIQNIRLKKVSSVNYRVPYISAYYQATVSIEAA